jgi:hypothetical protein
MHRDRDMPELAIPRRGCQRFALHELKPCEPGFERHTAHDEQAEQKQIPSDRGQRIGPVLAAIHRTVQM